jgi:radical SAM protein with 4Fe4S-binding SPASM domain
VKTVAVTVNRHEIFAMKRFVEEDLQLEFKFDGMINPRIDCSRSPLDVRLSPENVVELDLRDPRRVAEYQKFASRFNGPVHSGDRSEELYHCGGGISSFAIDPFGKLSICVLSHFDTYDLRNGSFHEGWQEFLFKVRRGKKVTLLTKCLSCEIKAVCGMCPANGELENGHPEKPVDFLCKTAHLRAYMFGFPPGPHGECEYCPGGALHEELMRSVLALQQVTPEESIKEEAATVPVEACGGGCASCSITMPHTVPGIEGMK